MNVLISGYIPAEGRYSMVRFARSIHDHLQSRLAVQDAVCLDEPRNAPVAPSLKRRNPLVKLEKRLLLPWRLWRKSCDVLHIVDSDYAAAVPRRHTSRTVVTCHDMMPFRIRGRLGGASPTGLGTFYRYKSRQRMAQCARVVCDSQSTREDVLEYTRCREEQLQVIHLGVEARFAQIAKDSSAVREFRAKHGLEGKRVVLHVGTAAVYKNIETLLTVVRKLVDTVGKNVALLKVGGTFSQEQEAAIGRLGLSDDIVHAADLSEDELLLAYNASDLLLWPSHFEGFGLPVLEAMACGTPVVCSNGGSLAEIAGDAAATHDPKDVDGLFGSCREVLECAETAERMRAAGLRHAAQFTWERTAAAYYEVYKAVHAGATS